MSNAWQEAQKMVEQIKQQAGGAFSQLGANARQLTGPKTYTSWNSPAPAMAQQMPVQNVAPVQQPPIQQPTQQPVQQPPQAPIGRVMTRDEVRPMVQKYWKGVDPEMVLNVIGGNGTTVPNGESNFRTNAVNINGPAWYPIPEGVRDQTHWVDLRKKHQSLDAGLMQINTAPAMTNYLISKGLTYYDLIQNPELNLQIAYDLYSGNIPKTARGWGNWYVAKNLGYK